MIGVAEFVDWRQGQNNSVEPGGRGAHPAAFLPLLQRFLFRRAVAGEAGHQVVEVDRVRVEVGPVDARELDPVADLDAAAAAHAGAVDHHGVQAHQRLDVPGPRDFRAGPHHDRRADRNRFVDVRMRGKRLLHALGDEALDAGRAVVGADDQLIAHRAELFLPEHHALVAESDDADHVGAVARIGAGLRIDGGHAEAAADAQHFLRAADVTGNAHGADDREQAGSDMAVLLHFARRLADGLDHQRDRALLGVEVGEREGNALPVFMLHHDDELPGLGGLGHRRMANLQLVGDVGVVLAPDDLEVRHFDKPRFHVIAMPAAPRAGIAAEPRSRFGMLR